MIDFDEEVAKFEPSQETDQVERVILKADIRDIADLLDKYLDGYKYEQ